MKTASEMTYTVSSGALNSTPTNQPRSAHDLCVQHVAIERVVARVHLRQLVAVSPWSVTDGSLTTAVPTLSKVDLATPSYCQ